MQTAIVITTTRFGTYIIGRVGEEEGCLHADVSFLRQCGNMQSIHALVLMHEGDQYMSRASIRNIKLLSGDGANVPGMGKRWDEGHTRSGLFFSSPDVRRWVDVHRIRQCRTCGDQSGCRIR